MTIITTIEQVRQHAETRGSLAQQIGLSPSRMELLVQTLPTLHTATVDAGVARCVIGHLITSGVSFIVEPEPDDLYTIAVKTEAANWLDRHVKECRDCRHD